MTNEKISLYDVSKVSRLNKYIKRQGDYKQMKKKNQFVLKLEAITETTLVVGIDIAKYIQWARFVDCRE
ncbi:MAG: hypothetical protein LBR68_02955 [Lachnoclostridium sp.]|nr:hypothetical protein [Lachnoclostridium sp.]